MALALKAAGYGTGDLTQVHLRAAQKAGRQSLQMRHPHYHHAPAIKGQDAQL